MAKVESQPGQEPARTVGPTKPWVDTWRRLRRNRLAVIGLAVIIVFVAIGSVETVAMLLNNERGLSPYPPNKANIHLGPGGPNSRPSIKHPFGTDYLGRDVFSRTLVATRISLLVGVFAVALSLAIGLVVGPVSGYYGGIVDTVMMRTADVFFAFPYILFTLLILAVRGPGFGNVIIAIGVLSWATYARLNRGSVLSIKQVEFVEAARALGAGDLRIIFRHVLPNTMAPIYVAISMGIGGAILTESALSYLGIGMRPPDASWGTLVSEGAGEINNGRWWLLMFPGMALIITVFGFIAFGNGLRDATDPKLKE